MKIEMTFPKSYCWLAGLAYLNIEFPKKMLEEFKLGFLYFNL